MIVVDEAHHFGAGIRDEALQMRAAPLRLGLTAKAPDGEPLAQLCDLLGPVVCKLSVQDLAGEWLADFDTVVLELRLTPLEQAQLAIGRQSICVRIAALHAVQIKNLILCVDEARCCDGMAFELTERVVRYRRNVDPRDVLALVDPRAHVTLPTAAPKRRRAPSKP